MAHASKPIQYPIGAFNCSEKDFITILKQFPPLNKIQKAKKITGPFDGKINSIYLIEMPENSVIFRTRISKAFRYEPIVKEKILYPLLDKTLTVDTPNLYEQIQQLTLQKEGEYKFTDQNPSIVPVQDLLYYYEPEDSIKLSSNPTPKEIYPPKHFPFLLTIKNFLPGHSFYDILMQNKQENHSPAILNVFERVGKYLSDLHQINFDGFYDKITDIGRPEKPSWADLFDIQWKKNMHDASQYPRFQVLIDPITRYLNDHVSIVEDEKEPVLFHNDYQAQNIILNENLDADFSSENKFEITGIIDFDNWRIGPRAQDFLKMEYWTIQGDEEWLNAFYRGYNQGFTITEDLKAGIALYKLLWFMLVYGFEMDKIQKNETNAKVDARFPSAEVYLDQIKQIVQDYL